MVNTNDCVNATVYVFDGNFPFALGATSVRVNLKRI